MTRIAIATLGCKTNAYESAAIVGQFDGQDVLVVPFDEPADLYIINTCTVTNRTDFKSRNLIRKALQQKALNPLAKVIVTGCYAQRSPGEIEAMGGVDLIVDNQSKLDIATILREGSYQFGDIMNATEFSYRPVSSMVDHSRAFQKIQDGCDFYCAYCAIPYARGHNRSAKLSDVVAQARLFVDSGYKEIVLGGVNLGLYRDGTNALPEVIQALHDIEGLQLIRLSSLEPQLITQEIISSLQHGEKLCPHLHIALQSGCDSVLGRMGRHYDTGQIRDLVDKLSSSIPSIALGFDVIVGFPGESLEEFEQTRKLLDALPIAYLHVFSYSKRKNTVAASLPNQVSAAEKSKRAAILTALSKRKKDLFMQRLINDQVDLRGICEAHKDGYTTMLTDHYLRAYLPGELELGSLACCVPTNTHLDGVLGQVEE